MKIEYETKNREPRAIFIDSFVHNALSNQTMYLPSFNDIKANYFQFSHLYLVRGAYKNTELAYCTFDHTICHRMLFYKTIFNHCQFINAQFEQCRFIECQFIDCDFDGISKNIDNCFINCNIYDFDNQAYFGLQGRNQVHSLHYIDEDCKTHVIHLDYIDIYQYKESNIKILESYDLSNMYLHRLDISNLYLKHFDFTNSNLRGMVFYNSIIENCVFDGCFFCVVLFRNAVFKSCSFRSAKFISNQLIGCEFIDCDFSNATQSIYNDNSFKDCNIDEFPI